MIIRLLVVSAILLWVSAQVLSAQAMAEDAGSWWKTPDQRGVELLQSGDAETASEVFRDSRWRGISHYRNGNFAEAQKEFAGSDDPDSLYNQGTAAARAGDYQTAVEKFEQVTKSDPSHDDAAHNLDIARQLLDKQQQSSDDSQQGEQGEQDDSETGDSENQTGDQQEGDQQQDGQQGDQEQGDQEQGEQSQQSESESKQQQSDGGGELSADEDQAKAAAEENQNQSAQSASEQSQSEQAEAADQSAKPSEQSASSAEVAQAEPISESEQATEQWMRRIPDDPSQLLRNKIKLNHMIQHENVRDLAEPW